MYQPQVFIALLAWIFISIGLFNKFSPQRATSLCVIMGYLFLPSASFDFPGLPPFGKYFSISLGLVLGGTFSGSLRRFPLNIRSMDIPMIILCFFTPVLTSISNGLGLYDGISNLVLHIFSWGIVFWTGRRYFNDAGSLKILLNDIVLGGAIYIPLIFFESRMSPKLSTMIYGFFAHSFLQHIRYGGWRPIVFLQHGLAVALWMAATTTAAYWLLRFGELKKIWRIPPKLLILLFIAATILCRSANGWSYLVIGLFTFSFCKLTKSFRLFRFLLLIVPLYMILRLSNLISAEIIQNLASLIFDHERVASLQWRILQEELFGVKGLDRPFLGWGGYDRGWPIDPYTGENLIEMIDSLWMIFFSTYGFLGLFGVYGSLGFAPWSVLGFYIKNFKKGIIENEKYTKSAIIICIIVIIFLIDSLLNAMINPVYILCSGVLVSHYYSCMDETNSGKIIDK